MHGTRNIKKIVLLKPSRFVFTKYSKSKFSQNRLIYCQLKWRHVSTQGVIIRPIIEPCLRYIKWKCTFLGS